MSVSRSEILMGRDREYPLDNQLERNLTHLLQALNKFRDAYKKPMVVTSGYRPGKYNVAAHGATHSSHLTCEAADFSDLGGELRDFCLANIPLLEACGLWMEDPASTPTWVHLQTRQVTNRVFHP